MTERLSWRTVKVSLVREAAPAPYSLRSGVDIARMFRSFIGEDPREHFVAAYLDARNKPVAIHRVSIGTTDACTVHPREVFLPAVHLSATRIVVAHNHPSGDPKPSPEDHALTNRLRSAGELLGIELLDHIVIGSARYYSFASEGTFALD